MRPVLVRLLSIAAAATAFVATVLVAPVAPVAALVPLTPAAVTFGPAHHALAGKHTGYNINGYNWGGYAATGSGFTSVSATWTQPTATCNSSRDLYAPWVGLDGYGSSTVEQTGVATDCSSGRAVNEPWYEMYPANPVYLNTSSYPVSFGDSIHASVTYASSRFTLTLADTTRGWTYTTSKTLSSARRLSAEVIIESPTGAYPKFGTINFSSATVNGNTLGSYSPVAMDPSNGVYEAHTGALSGGTSFGITYQHE